MVRTIFTRKYASVVRLPEGDLPNLRRALEERARKARPNTPSCANHALLFLVRH